VIDLLDKKKGKAMKVSKCCKAKVIESWDIIGSPPYEGQVRIFICSKCHKPCEVIDLSDGKKEER